MVVDMTISAGSFIGRGWLAWARYPIVGRPGDCGYKKGVALPCNPFACLAPPAGLEPATQ